MSADKSTYRAENGLEPSSESLKEKESDTKTKKKRSRSTPWNIGCRAWCLKYFLEGQALEKGQEDAVRDLSPNAPLHEKILVKYRRPIGILIPAIFFHFCWWSFFIRHDLWHLFEDKYFMTITMIFGSMIAGMTSEGGGAIAFPVMTLAFSIHPSVARDFSIMIQSCGMSAAAFTIFFMKVKLEWNSLIFSSLGGMFGIIFGLHFIDPILTPHQKKMGFISIWFAFAFALFLLNRFHKRHTFEMIPEMNKYKMLILVVTGFVGGIFTAFSGSGLDICSFSILTLLFRVSEKTATPTSVILMAGNSLVGFYWRQVIFKEVSTDAWEFLGVCVPIVVIGAPLGSLLGTHFHRQVLASLVYLVDTVALIGGFVLVKPSQWLAIVSCFIIIGGFVFFGFLAFIGHRMMENILSRKEKETEKMHKVGYLGPGSCGETHINFDPQRKITRSSSTENGVNDKPFDNGIYLTAL